MWNLEGDEKWLSDGDHILLEKSCDDRVPYGHVMFGLVCSVTSWKSITVYDENVFLYELLSIQDDPGVTKFATIDAYTQDVFNYVLSKETSFGIHTPKYKIANAGEMVPGCAYIFKWLED